MSRDQVRTQLANYKESRYGNSQIELLVNADELDEDLRLSLSMETNEFVTTTMKRLLDETKTTIHNNQLIGHATILSRQQRGGEAI